MSRSFEVHTSSEAERAFENCLASALQSFSIPQNDDAGCPLQQLLEFLRITGKNHPRLCAKLLRLAGNPVRTCNHGPEVSKLKELAMLAGQTEANDHTHLQAASPATVFCYLTNPLDFVGDVRFNPGARPFFEPKPAYFRQVKRNEKKRVQLVWSDISCQYLDNALARSDLMNWLRANLDKAAAIRCWKFSKSFVSSYNEHATDDMLVTAEAMKAHKVATDGAEHDLALHAIWAALPQKQMVRPCHWL